MSTENFHNATKRSAGIATAFNAFLDNPTLTGMAKYLLIQMTSHSDSWKLNMTNIIKRSKNGRDAHYNAMKELISAKYVARVRIFNDKGRVESWNYIYSQNREDVKSELAKFLLQTKKDSLKTTVEYGSPLTDNQEVENTPHSEKPKVDKKPLTEKPKVDNTPDTDSQEMDKNPLTEKPYTDNQGYYKKQSQENKNKDISNLVLDDDKKIIISNLNNIEKQIVLELQEAVKYELTQREFTAVLLKVIDKKKQGGIHQSFRDYLVTAVSNRIDAKHDSPENVHKDYSPAPPMPKYDWLGIKTE
jgi:hypothetical protein